MKEKESESKGQREDEEQLYIVEDYIPAATSKTTEITKVAFEQVTDKEHDAKEKYELTKMKEDKQMMEAEEETVHKEVDERLDIAGNLLQQGSRFTDTKAKELDVTEIGSTQMQKKTELEYLETKHEYEESLMIKEKEKTDETEQHKLLVTEEGNDEYDRKLEMQAKYLQEKELKEKGMKDSCIIQEGEVTEISLREQGQEIAEECKVTKIETDITRTEEIKEFDEEQLKESRKPYITEVEQSVIFDEKESMVFKTEEAKTMKRKEKEKRGEDETEKVEKPEELEKQKTTTKEIDKKAENHINEEELLEKGKLSTEETPGIVEETLSKKENEPEETKEKMRSATVIEQTEARVMLTQKGNKLTEEEREEEIKVGDNRMPDLKEENKYKESKEIQVEKEDEYNNREDKLPRKEDQLKEIEENEKGTVPEKIEKKIEVKHIKDEENIKKEDEDAERLEKLIENKEQEEEEILKRKKDVVLQKNEEGIVEREKEERIQSEGEEERMKIEEKMTEEDRVKIANKEGMKMEEDQRLKKEKEKLKRKDEEWLRGAKEENLKTEGEKHWLKKEDEETLKREEGAKLEREEEKILKKEEEETVKMEEQEMLKKKEEEMLKREEEERVKKNEEETLKGKEEERLKREEYEKLKREDKESLKKEDEERLKKEEERIKQQEKEKLKREEEEKVKREKEEMLKREEEERLKKQEEERLRKEEEERLKREKKEEMLKKEREERMRKDEEERLKKEVERLKKEEEEMLKREEEEKLKKEQEERMRRDEEEKLRKEEQERLKKEEEKRLKREEEERFKKEEEERLVKEEEERIKREEEERLKNEEEERLKEEEKERMKKEEEEKHRKEEERLRKKEEERLKKEEEEQMKKETEERVKKEKKERMKIEQEERIKQEKEERLKAEEEERRKYEEEEMMKKEEKEMLKQQEEERQKKQEEKRFKKEKVERLKREKEERLKKEEEERLKREEEEILKKQEEEERLKKENEDRRKKEKERLKREEEERLKKEKEERLIKEKEEKRIKDEEERLKKQEDEMLKKKDEEKLKKEKEEKHRKEEEERLKREEEERLNKEKEERLKEEEKERLKREEERLKKEEEERLRKEKEERRKLEENERLKREEEGILEKEKEKRLKREKKEKLSKTKGERLKKEEEERKKKDQEEMKREENLKREKEESLKREEFERRKSEEEIRKIQGDKGLKKDEKDKKLKEKQTVTGQKEESLKIAEERIRKDEQEMLDGKKQEMFEKEKALSKETEEKINNAEEINEVKKKLKEREGVGKQKLEDDAEMTEFENKKGKEKDMKQIAIEQGLEKKEYGKTSETKKKYKVKQKTETEDSASSLTSTKSFPISLKIEEISDTVAVFQSTTEEYEGGIVEEPTTDTSLKVCEPLPLRIETLDDSLFGLEDLPSDRRTLDTTDLSRDLQRMLTISEVEEIPTDKTIWETESNRHVVDIVRDTVGRWDLTDIEIPKGFKRDPMKKPKFSMKLPELSATKGSRIKLTCSLLTSPDAEAMVEWFKNGFPLTADYRKYNISYDSGIASLEVLQLTRDDTAEYTCMAKNQHGRASTTCHLRVRGDIEPKPTPPTFIRGIQQAYIPEDDEIIMECTVSGYPLPKITWVKDGSRLHLSSRFQQSVGKDGRCRLVITAPRYGDSGTYSCVAENRVWKDEVSAAIFVGDKGVRPERVAEDEGGAGKQQEGSVPQFASDLCDQAVSMGDTVVLESEITGSPTPDVMWLRNGRTIPPSQKIKNTVQRNVYALTVMNITASDLGVYTCRASSEYGTAHSSASIQFRYGEKGKEMMWEQPALIVDKPESFLPVVKDEDIVLACRIVGNPQPKVTWFKGTRDLTYSGRAVRETEGDVHRLIIKRALVTDSGTYTVEAKNIYGTDKAYCTIRVLAGPPSTVEPLPDYSVPYRRALLDIDAQIPQPYYGGRVKERARSQTPTPLWEFRGATDILRDLDDRRARRFIRDVPGPVASEPGPTEMGRNWVSLTWTKPEYNSGAPVIAYKVEAWLLGEGAVWTELGMSPITCFDAFNLKPDREYLFRVTPRNRYGWGEPVTTSKPVSIGKLPNLPQFVRPLPGRLKVMTGKQVQLECEVKGEPTPYIKWYREGTEIDFEKNPRFMAKFMGKRSTLNIEEVYPGDEGKYVCEATNQAGRVTTFTRLLIIEDPKVLEADEKLSRDILSLSQDREAVDIPPQFAMRLRDRRVQVAYPVRLTCQVFGNPVPEVTWYKDGEETVQDNRRTLWHEENFLTLEISSSRYEDSGIYSVNTKNEHGAVSCKCRLMVDRGVHHYIPPVFIYEVEDSTVFVGETISLVARVEAYPAVGVTWHRNGIRIRPNRRYRAEVDHEGNVSLVIHGAAARDAGQYTCTVSNEMGKVACKSKVVVQSKDAEVLEEPLPGKQLPMAPRFVKKPRSTEAVEGDRLIIMCEVIGDPKPEVVWLRDWLKPDYYVDADHFVRVGDGPVYQLEIPSVKIDYTGAYSVVATNCHGEAKAVISLQISAIGQGQGASMDQRPTKHGALQSVPEIAQHLKNLRCCDGDSVTFECRVMESSPPPDIRWEKRGKILRLLEDFVLEFDGQTARLLIKEVYPEDEGEYTCVFHNDLGRAHTSACLVVDIPEEKENDLTAQLENTQSWSRPRVVSPRTRSPSVTRKKEGSAETTKTKLKSKFVEPKFYSVPHNKIAEAGETVRFQCAIAGRPLPTVLWDKDGSSILGEGRIRLEERDDIRVLEIPSVTHDDAGLYRITIENEIGRAQASARLEVLGKPGSANSVEARACHTAAMMSPYFTRRITGVHTRSGGRALFSAEVTGNPIPRCKWYRNGEPVPQCDDFVTTWDGKIATLEILEVYPEDAGIYTCIAENEMSEASCEAELQVTGTAAGAAAEPPVFVQGLVDLVARDGHPAELAVRVTGTPSLEIVWVRNDQEIKDCDDFRYVTSGDGNYSLIVADVFPDDAGIYICEAYNTFGDAYTWCRVKVIDHKEATLQTIEEGTSVHSCPQVTGNPSLLLDGRLGALATDASWRCKVENDGDLPIVEPLRALSPDPGQVTRAGSIPLRTDHRGVKPGVNPFDSDQVNSYSRNKTFLERGGADLASRASDMSSDPLPHNLPDRLAEKNYNRTEVVDRNSWQSNIREHTAYKSPRDSSQSSSHCENMSGRRQSTDVSEAFSGRQSESSDDMDSVHSRLPARPRPLLDTVSLGSWRGSRRTASPATIIKGPQSVTVLRGESVTLRAHFFGNPEPRIRWLRGGKEVTSGPRTSIENVDGTSSLTIRDITADDGGKYIVMLENNCGSDRDYASLAVEGPPDPPAGLPNISAASKDTLTLSWYGSTYDGGSIITGYIVEMKREGSSDWETVTASCHSTSYMVRGLNRSQKYIFRVRAENVHGVSEPGLESQPVNLSPAEAAENSDEEDDFKSPFEHRQVIFEPGEVFREKYEVHEELGKGRFGVVYKVVDKQTSEKFAAKFVKCIKSKDKNKVTEEVDVMNKLRHPKLLQLAAAYENPRDVILVTEYISGGELFERVVADDFTLTERDCILFMRQICEGVLYMHDTYIVHLDLKPENIMCQRRTSHQIKLIDFGLARTLDPEVPVRVLFGTPEFIPPEIINYEPISLASDMWSVGVICYVLLSGLSPFMGENDAETFANITRAAYDFDVECFDDLSLDAKNFISSLLVKRKEKRMTASQCLQHKWLAQHENSMKAVKLSTDKLKKFIIRRKWQKTANAIRALGRMTSLNARRNSNLSSVCSPQGSVSSSSGLTGMFRMSSCSSVSSAASHMSSLAEESISPKNTNCITSLSDKSFSRTGSELFPNEHELDRINGYESVALSNSNEDVVLRRGSVPLTCTSRCGSMYSERSDSGISDCSVPPSSNRGILCKENSILEANEETLTDSEEKMNYSYEKGFASSFEHSKYPFSTAKGRNGGTEKTGCLEQNDSCGSPISEHSLLAKKIPASRIGSEIAWASHRKNVTSRKANRVHDKSFNDVTKNINNLKHRTTLSKT